jgi:hypothetical protein
MTTIIFSAIGIAGVAFLIYFLIALGRDHPREVCQIDRVKLATWHSAEQQSEPATIIPIDDASGLRWSRAGNSAAQASLARRMRSL